AVRSVNLDRGVVDAEHDGYRRLDDPVTHRRWLVAAPDEPTVAVIDLLDGHSVHDVAVSWPLHPDLHAEPNLRGHRVSRNGSVVLELLYAATSSVETEQVRGDATTDRGWWSDRLEARIPAWWVGARCRTAGPVALLTVLHIGAGGVVGDADVAMTGSTLTARWSEGGVWRSLTIDTDRNGAVTGTSSSVERLVSKS
ncbi:MAG TPA: heparinase II/III family protein, partial [Mycobacterium sp.]|nr:heparinase II/III family protein [Mycobacterium sp.]